MLCLPAMIYIFLEQTQKIIALYNGDRPSKSKIINPLDGHAYEAEYVYMNYIYHVGLSCILPMVASKSNQRWEEMLLIDDEFSFINCPASIEDNILIKTKYWLKNVCQHAGKAEPVELVLAPLEPSEAPVEAEEEDFLGALGGGPKKESYYCLKNSGTLKAAKIMNTQFVYTNIIIDGKWLYVLRSFSHKSRFVAKCHGGDHYVITAAEADGLFGTSLSSLSVPGADFFKNLLIYNETQLVLNQLPKNDLKQISIFFKQYLISFNLAILHTTLSMHDLTSALSAIADKVCLGFIYAKRDFMSLDGIYIISGELEDGILCEIAKNTITFLKPYNVDGLDMGILVLEIQNRHIIIAFLGTGAVYVFYKKNITNLKHEGFYATPDAMYSIIAKAVRTFIQKCNEIEFESLRNILAMFGKALLGALPAGLVCAQMVLSVACSTNLAKGQIFLNQLQREVTSKFLGVVVKLDGEAAGEQEGLCFSMRILYERLSLRHLSHLYARSGFRPESIGIDQAPPGYPLKPFWHKTVHFKFFPGWITTELETCHHRTLNTTYYLLVYIINLFYTNSSFMRFLEPVVFKPQINQLTSIDPFRFGQQNNPTPYSTHCQHARQVRIISVRDAEMYLKAQGQDCDFLRYLNATTKMDMVIACCPPFNKISVVAEVTESQMARFCCSSNIASQRSLKGQIMSWYKKHTILSQKQLFILKHTMPHNMSLVHLQQSSKLVTEGGFYEIPIIMQNLLGLLKQKALMGLPQHPVWATLWALQALVVMLDTETTEILRQFRQFLDGQTRANFISFLSNCNLLYKPAVESVFNWLELVDQPPTNIAKQLNRLDQEILNELLTEWAFETLGIFMIVTNASAILNCNKRMLSAVSAQITQNANYQVGLIVFLNNGIAPAIGCWWQESKAPNYNMAPVWKMPIMLSIINENDKAHYGTKQLDILKAAGCAIECVYVLGTNFLAGAEVLIHQRRGFIPLEYAINLTNYPARLYDNSQLNLLPPNAVLLLLTALLGTLGNVYYYCEQNTKMLLYMETNGLVAPVDPSTEYNIPKQAASFTVVFIDKHSWPFAPKRTAQPIDASTIDHLAISTLYRQSMPRLLLRLLSKVCLAEGLNKGMRKTVEKLYDAGTLTTGIWSLGLESRDLVTIIQLAQGGLNDFATELARTVFQFDYGPYIDELNLLEAKDAKKALEEKIKQDIIIIKQYINLPAMDSLILTPIYITKEDLNYLLSTIVAAFRRKLGPSLLVKGTLSPPFLLPFIPFNSCFWYNV